MINLLAGILAGGVSYLLGLSLTWILVSVVVTFALWTTVDWVTNGYE